MTTDKRGNPICPKCGNTILGRIDNKIYCLKIDKSCDWFTESKREEDKEIPEIHKLKELWK